MKFLINNEAMDLVAYQGFHARRIAETLDTVSALGPTSLVEVGGHPWLMTAHLVDRGLPVTATVSAEEVTCWPDMIEARVSDYTIKSDHHEASFVNHSANIERSWIDLETPVDCVLCCEIVEHLVRSPHRLLLNCNQWLKPGGRVVLTTPNGAQFANPFRNKSRDPFFRDSVYKRHNRVFTMAELVDLFEVCGFEVERAEHWQVYERRGMARLYDLLGKVPIGFFKNKFTRTLFIQARKSEDRTTASRLPRCYAAGDDWDFIDGIPSG